MSARETFKEAPLICEQVVKCTIDTRTTRLGEFNLHAAAIIWIRSTNDEPFLLEPVDAIRHRSRRHQCRGTKRSGRKPIRLTRAAKRSEDVEFPHLKVVGFECLLASEVKVLRKTRDAGEDGERSHIKFWSLTLPGVDETIDLVLGQGL